MSEEQPASTTLGGHLQIGVSAAAASEEAGKAVPLHNTASLAALASAGSIPSDAWPKGKEHYTMIKQLGSGATSDVWKAFCESKNMEIAIKVVNLDSSSVSMDELHRETQGMKKLRHENIVAYYGSFIENKYLYILMDLCERSLLDMINHSKSSRDISNGVFDENTIATILREVLKGLHYIHENGLVHRDIKCGNILLKKDGSVLIADFGVTAFINTNPLTGSTANPVCRHTFVGTPCWMAPEVMEQRSDGYTQKADIWSLGITALELVSGSAPYSRYTPMKVIILTLNNDPPNLNTMEEKNGQFSAYGHKFRKFVVSCLVRNDKDRPSAKQLLQHSFIKNKAKEKEYIVKAILSGDIPVPTTRSASGKSGADNQEESGDDDDDWEFPVTTNADADSTPVVDSVNQDCNLPWYKQALEGKEGTLNIKFRLRKRKDDAMLQSTGAEQEDAASSVEPVVSGGSAAASGSPNAGHILPELQDISFDFQVGKDKANGITMELVESGLVSMHDMVVISRALQTLVDAPWSKEKVFSLNSPLPPGLFADQQEFLGYAGLAVVSIQRKLAGSSKEETVKLVPPLHSDSAAAAATSQAVPPASSH